MVEPSRERAVLVAVWLLASFVLGLNAGFFLAVARAIP